MEKKIRVLLADDHQIVIDGIKSLLVSSDDIEIVDEANTGLQALEKAKKLKPQVVVMDIDMPEMSGLDATRQLKSIDPDIRVLALTMHNEKGMITKMMDAGARGFVLKNTGREDLLQAIHKVAAGEKYYSSHVTETLLNGTEENGGEDVSLESLTQREREILQYIAEGNSNTEIGDKLFISHRTVDTHRTNLMKKLNVKNIAGLIKYCYRHGLIE